MADDEYARLKVEQLLAVAKEFAALEWEVEAAHLAALARALRQADRAER